MLLLLCLGIFVREISFAQQDQAAGVAAPGADAAPDAGTSEALQNSGSVSGIVVDQNGNFVPGARVKLTSGKQEAGRISGEIEGKILRGLKEQKGSQLATGEDGNFLFPVVKAGPFEITVSAPGFASQTVSGTLRAGEALRVPDIALAIGSVTTEVRVGGLTQHQLAQKQLDVEEKQRVLGVIPNFYVTYNRAAPPLSPKQKFQLAWKTVLDPVAFGAAAAVAGVEQEQGIFSGYGSGADGYAKRFGASYTDDFVGTMIGGAILPSLLKQDPRYFYKGTGTTRSRILNALAFSVMCKGDNGHWQPNYSGILGSLAAGGISNLYYPPSDRGAGLVFANTSLGVAFSFVGNLFQEFVVRHLTPHAQTPQP